MQATLISRSPEDTANYGRKLARVLRGESVILLLFGDLGSGKTTFVRGLVDGFGGSLSANSPSFNILNIYDTSKGYTIYHIDAYRGAKVSWESLMLDDIIESPFCCAIEWPENFQNLPTYPTVKAKFSLFQKNSRFLTISTEEKPLAQDLAMFLKPRITRNSYNGQGLV